MSNQFVLSTRLTADAASLKAGFDQGSAAAKAYGDQLDQTRARVSTLSDAIKRSANVRDEFGGKERAADIAAYGQAMDALRAKYNPLFAQQRAYVANLKEIAQAEKLGALSAKEAAAARAATKSGFARSVGDSQAKTSGGLTTFQRQQLSFQVNDVFTSLTSGMNPLQVLAQQGPQVVQVYGGVRQTISAVRAELTATRVAAIGAVGIIVAGAKAWADWDAQQTRMQIALNGVGRGAGVTLDGLNAIADQRGAAGGLSISAGRDLAAGYAGTGRIGGALIGDLLQTTKRYARVTGQDTADAGAELAKAFADPVKGADTLNERMGFLDGRTKELIRSLDASGQTAKAQGVLFRAYSEDLKLAADRTNAVVEGWERVKQFGSNQWSKFGEDIADAINSKGGLDPSGLSIDKQIAQLKQAEEIRKSSLPTTIGNLFGGNDDYYANRYRQQLAALEARKAAEEKAAQDRKKEQDNRREGIAAGDLVQSFLPDDTQLKQLQEALARLSKATADPGIASGMKTSAEQNRQAIEAVTGAIDSRMTSEEKARESERLTIASIDARTVAEKASIAAARERLSLAGQLISTAEQERRIEAARAVAVAQANRDSRDQLKSANDNAALSALSPYQRQLAEIDQKYRDKLADNQGAGEGTLANIRNARSAEIYAAQQNAIGSPLRSANQSLTEQVAALKLQQDAFGKSAGEAAKLAAAQQLVNQYNAAGVPITAQLRAAIDSYAAGVGKVAQASEDLAKKQQQVISSLDQVRDTSRETFGGFVKDIAGGKSATEALTSAASRIGDRLIDNAANTVTSGLFGANGTAGGGLFGDALGGIFGKQVGLSTADISANIVNLNGGLNGAVDKIIGGGFNPAAANTNVAGAEPLKGLGPTATVTSSALAPVSLANAGTTASEPVKAAFLDAIAATESGGKYNIRYGGLGSAGKIFSDFSRHPDILERTKDGKYSSAAGAFQITGSTYRDYGGGAFDANAQRSMAWRIAQDRSGLGAGLEGYLQKNGLDQSLLTKLNPTWRGFADNPTKALSAYQASLTRYQQAGPDTAMAQLKVPGLQQLQTSLGQLGNAAQGVAPSLTNVLGGMTSLPNPLQAVATNAVQASAAVGQGGGGLAGALMSLLSSIGSAVFGGISGHADGGRIEGYADGGRLISGPGTGRSDSILATTGRRLLKVSNGESINTAEATRKYWPMIDAMNKGHMPAFADGGMVRMDGPVSASWQRSAVANSNRPSQSSSSGSEPPQIIIENHVGAEVATQQERTSSGGWRARVRMMDRLNAQATGRPNSLTQQAWAASARIPER